MKQSSRSIASLVDYYSSSASSSESEDDKLSTKECEEANPGSLLSNVGEVGSTEPDAEQQMRPRSGPETRSDDHQEEEDGMNSLHNIMSLREKMAKVIRNSVVEYPVDKYVQFRNAEAAASRQLEQGKIKQVTSISVSKNGDRMICGVISGEIEIYDFSNLYENDMSPNKVICPLENHSIQNVEFNENGSLFLAACGDSICRVFQSNGEFITGTVQGDPYVKSAKSNPGHTHMILSCKWDPENCCRFITCSIDNTIRLFDLNSDPFGVDGYIPSTFVMKCLDRRNLNISSIQANSVCISPLGEKIAASCTDGSIQIFSRNGNVYSETPSVIIRDAHSSDKNGNAKSISDVVFVKHNLSQDTYLASRGVIDESIKIWDIRKTSSPLKHIGNLPCDGSEHSKLVLSKCATSILTSSTLVRDGPNRTAGNHHVKSSLVSLKVDTLLGTSECSVQKLVTIDNQAISTFEWSHEINQIFVALNDSSIIAYYDEGLESNPSNKGVLSVFGKKRKHQFQGFSNASLEAYNIDELPDGFKETKSGEIKYVGSGSRRKSKLYAPKHPNIL